MSSFKFLFSGVFHNDGELAHAFTFTRKNTERKLAQPSQVTQISGVYFTLTQIHFILNPIVFFPWGSVTMKKDSEAQ